MPEFYIGLIIAPNIFPEFYGGTPYPPPPVSYAYEHSTGNYSVLN